MQLIPAIDLRGGRVVRLLQGRFEAETVYAEDSMPVLETYAGLGARLVHVVDLDGARAGGQRNSRAIAALAASNCVPLQVGGGLRDRAAVTQLLDAGVQRVVIGSAAVSEPREVESWLRDIGPDRIVLAFDVRLDDAGTPRLATHGWQRQTAVDLWDAVELYVPHGLRHVLCTDVARDGALSGPNLALYSEAVRRYPAIRWQASGGVRDVADLHALESEGVAAAVSGRALLEGCMQPGELAPFLRSE